MTGYEDVGGGLMPSDRLVRDGHDRISIQLGSVRGKHGVRPGTQQTTRRRTGITKQQPQHRITCF